MLKNIIVTTNKNDNGDCVISVSCPENMYGIISYGQSREEGGQQAGGNPNNPPVTTSPPAGVYGFEAYHATENGFNGNLNPATVSNTERKNLSMNGRGQWPSLSAAIDLKARLEAALNDCSDFTVFNAAVGGSSIDELSKGTAPYKGVTDRVERLQQLKINKILGFSYTQGIADAVDSSNYKADLIKLLEDFNADIKSINGQTQDIPFFMSQIVATANIHRNIGLKQLELSKQDNRFIITNPLYMLDFYDIQHINNDSAYIVGLYRAKAMYQTLFMGVKFEALQSIEAVKTGDFIDITYNRSGLEFDVSIFPNQHGFYGFSANSSISSISIVSKYQPQDTVRIKAPNATKLHYCKQKPSIGRSDSFKGFSGNLRDNSGNSSYNGFVTNDWALAEDWQF